MGVLAPEMGHGVNGDSRHLLPAAAADALAKIHTVHETLLPAISFQAA
ncbi:hypothetical protein [Actinoallomurus sp. NPDC052274]